MAKSCKCKKDYKISVGLSRTESRIEVLFERCKDYYFYNKGTNEFYVTTDKKYLKDINYYSTNIELMDKKEFDEYFYYDKIYKTKPSEFISSEKLYEYNNMVGVINISNDLFNTTSIDDISELQRLHKELGFGEYVGIYNGSKPTTNFLGMKKRNYKKKQLL